MDFLSKSRQLTLHSSFLLYPLLGAPSFSKHQYLEWSDSVQLFYPLCRSNCSNSCLKKNKNLLSAKAEFLQTFSSTCSYSKSDLKFIHKINVPLPVPKNTSYRTINFILKGGQYNYELRRSK